MHPRRLVRRVSSAIALEPAILDAHRLACHKRGRDGSGKGDIVPSRDACVIGVVYAIDRRHQGTLDRCEGHGYLRATVEIRGLRSRRRYRAYAYRARKSAVDDRLRPFEWYRDLMLAGARWHDLPDFYCDMLIGIATRHDVNRRRHRQHQAIARRWPPRRLRNRVASRFLPGQRYSSFRDGGHDIRSLPRL